MQIVEIMTEDVETGSPELSLSEALRILHDGDFRHLPIVDGRGELVGMISERDIREQFMPLLVEMELREETAVDPMQQAVADIMSGAPLSVQPEDDVAEAIEIMLTNRVGALPVVDSATGELRGIVSYVDVLRAAQDYFN